MLRLTDRSVAEGPPKAGIQPSAKPPPSIARMERALFPDLEEMRQRWATGTENTERILRNVGGILFSLLLAGMLHMAISLTE